MKIRGEDHQGTLSDRSAKPLEVARKRKCQPWEATTSADGSTSEEDEDPDNEYEGTSSRPPLSSESRTSGDTCCPRKKTPMPQKVSSHVTDEDGQNATNEEDQLASTGKTDKMKPTCNPQKRSSTTAIHLFALTIWPSLASMATSFLDDTSKYLDGDGFESIPFTDAHTTKPGASGQHRMNGKLKSALKQVPRSEAQNVTVQPESQRGIVDSSTSTSRPRKPAPKKGASSGAGNDQGLPAAEGTITELWHS
ncbi:hypothetical protein EDD15DRAFT_2197398 [Pisolithus albus]|nr:hypothetical protein EDD15DRAFT_2197398 [Pisolithus albus]